MGGGYTCPHEATILDLKNLGPIIENMAKAQAETLAVVRSLADQEKRILYTEIGHKELKRDLDNMYERVRRLETVPMYFPEWKKGVILLLVGWVGSGVLSVVLYKWMS